MPDFDNISVLGDLGEQAWAEPLEMVEWETLEHFYTGIFAEFGLRNKGKKHEKTREKMSQLFYQLEVLNATLYRQFFFNYHYGQANDVTSVESIYSEMVDVYGKQPGQKSEIVLKKLAQIYHEILILNKTLEHPMCYYYVLQSCETECAFLWQGELVTPADWHANRWEDMGRPDHFLPFLLKSMAKSREE